jgi:uncharacterized protein (TIGR02145 family)
MKRIDLRTILISLLVLITSCEKDNDELGKVNDIDGNEYSTIKIGNQIWFLENLKTTHYNDGTSIRYSEDSSFKDTLGEYWDYNNEAKNSEIYGRLYNGFAASSGKLAPKGFHVATVEDWLELELFLVKNGYNYNGLIDTGEDIPPNFNIGKSLAVTYGWKISEVEGNVGYMQESNNSSGFSAIPGGRFDFGRYILDSVRATWWCGDYISKYNGYSRSLFYNRSFLGESEASKSSYGFHIRCVKD